MDFQQAEKKFKQLKAGYEAGDLSEAEFKTQLEELMVQDEAGTWWMIGFETEQWYRHDGTEWVQADPPGSVSHKPIPPIEAEVMETNIQDQANQEISEKVAKEKSEQENIEPDKKEKRRNTHQLIIANQRKALLIGFIGLIPFMALLAPLFYEESGIISFTIPMICGGFAAGFSIKNIKTTNNINFGKVGSILGAISGIPSLMAFEILYYIEERFDTLFLMIAFGLLIIIMAWLGGWLIGLYYRKISK